jgi:hypothetical protein
MKEFLTSVAKSTGLEYKVLHFIAIYAIGVLVQGFYQHCTHGLNLVYFFLYIALALLSSIMYYKVFNADG